MGTITSDFINIIKENNISFKKDVGSYRIVVDENNIYFLIKDPRKNSNILYPIYVHDLINNKCRYYNELYEDVIDVLLKEVVSHVLNKV